MTEQEIEAAAEKHTETLPKATRLTGFFAFKGGVRWSEEYRKTHSDEYAEEYAKAFLGFIRVNNDPEFAARNGDDLLRRFKESLKK